MSSTNAHTHDDSSDTPLVDALIKQRTIIRANFFCPGHKQRLGPSSSNLHTLLGHSALSADLPELPALDNLASPCGPIAAAQHLAADTFTRAGRSHWRSHFVVNGGTGAVTAALLSVTRPDRYVILPRNAHQSAVHALTLCGSIPLWVDAQYDASSDLVHGVDPTHIQHALYSVDPALVDAVFVVSPTYHGVLSDIPHIVSIAHAAKIPLIVDEAHGSHLATCTNNTLLPLSAVEQGADLVIHSAHKTLPALSQAAILHVRAVLNDATYNPLVDPNRVAAALRTVQSSSPSYLLLASLDAATATMRKHGNQLLAHTVRMARECATRINQLPAFSVLQLTHDKETPGVFALDPTRITIILHPSIRMSGYELDDLLIEQYGVYAELPAFRHVTFALSVANTERELNLLVSSLTDIQQQRQQLDETYQEIVYQCTSFKPVPAIQCMSNVVMTPREAFFANAESVQTHIAVGRVSAETLCPYPPGIPVIVPGERVTQTAVDAIKAVLDAGGSVSGAADESLSTIRCVCEER